MRHETRTMVEKVEAAYTCDFCPPMKKPKLAGHSCDICRRHLCDAHWVYDFYSERRPKETWLVGQSKSYCRPCLDAGVEQRARQLELCKAFEAQWAEQQELWHAKAKAAETPPQEGP